MRYLLGFYPERCAHPFLTHWQHLKPFADVTIGYVPELPFLDPYLSGYETLTLLAEIKHYPLSRQQAQAVATSVGLPAEVLPDAVATYSKGMKQRLMLAQASLGAPQILMMDEPLSGLDPFGHQTIMHWLNQLKKTCRLILSTHALEDAFQLADDIWLLQAGKIVCQTVKPDSIEALRALYFQYPPIPSTA